MEETRKQSPLTYKLAERERGKPLKSGKDKEWGKAAPWVICPSPIPFKGKCMEGWQEGGL